MQQKKLTPLSVEELNRRIVELGTIQIINTITFEYEDETFKDKTAV